MLAKQPLGSSCTINPAIHFLFFDLDDEIEQYFGETIERLKFRYISGKHICGHI